MKIFRVLLFAVAIRAFGQGEVVFDNFNSISLDPMATSRGLFWISTAGSPVLINQDFNAALYGGTDSSNLQLLTTVLLSNGTGIHDNPQPGYFREPSGDSYVIPGALNNAYVQVQAWVGNYNSYGAAVAAGVPAAQSPIFVNPVGLAPGPAQDLIAMPGMVLSVPEPPTFALFGLGGLCVLLLCRRRRADPSPVEPGLVVLQYCSSGVVEKNRM